MARASPTGIAGRFGRARLLPSWSDAEFARISVDSVGFCRARLGRSLALPSLAAQSGSCTHGRRFPSHFSERMLRLVNLRNISFSAQVAASVASLVRIAAFCTEWIGDAARFSSVRRLPTARSRQITSEFASTARFAADLLAIINERNVIPADYPRVMLDSRGMVPRQ